MVDLPALLGGSLLAALQALTGEDELTVLLLDDVTRRVLSRCCRLSDVMGEASVTLVEQLHAPAARRAPPGMAASLSAIYFVAPSEGSVIALVRDLAGRRPLYGGRRHVLLTSAAPVHLRETLEALLHQGALSSFRECAAVEALALHARGFSLDAPSALCRLYGPPIEEAHLLASLRTGSVLPRAAALSHAAEQIGKLCALLGDTTPSVRVRARDHPVAKELAAALLALTSTPSKTAGVVAGGGTAALRRNVSVLILDRSSDLLTPLMHDFSVEALAEATGVLVEGRFRRGAPNGRQTQPGELSESQANGAANGTAPGGEAGAGPASEVLLVGSDPLWTELRFCKVDEMEELILERTRGFVAANAVIDGARERLARREKLSTREMVEVNKRLASVAYRRREESLKVADEIRAALFGKLLPPDPPPLPPGAQTAPAGRGAARPAEMPLYRLLMLEQDLATGRDGATGYALKAGEALARLVEQLKLAPVPDAAAHAGVAGQAAAAGDGGDAAVERQRLLLLQALALPLTDAARAPLVAAAGLDPEAVEAISRGLFCVGARPGRRGAAAAPKPAAAPGTTVLARHTPALCGTLRAALSPPPVGASGAGSSGSASSRFVWLRRRVREPGDGAGTTAAPDGAARPVGSWALRARPGAEQRGKPVLLVFMIGGASHAEMRCAHEAAVQHAGCDLVFGSTAVLTPAQFAASLVRTQPMPPLGLPPSDDW